MALAFVPPKPTLASLLSRPERAQPCTRTLHGQSGGSAQGSTALTRLAPRERCAHTLSPPPAALLPRCRRSGWSGHFPGKPSLGESAALPFARGGVCLFSPRLSRVIFRWRLSQLEGERGRGPAAGSPAVPPAAGRELRRVPAARLLLPGRVPSSSPIAAQRAPACDGFGTELQTSWCALRGVGHRGSSWYRSHHKHLKLDKAGEEKQRKKEI